MKYRKKPAEVEDDLARTERMLNFIGKAIAHDNAKKWMELSLSDTTIQIPRFHGRSYCKRIMEEIKDGTKLSGSDEVR